MKEQYADYYGQSTEGYTHIGTESFKLPLNSSIPPATLEEEVKRRCGEKAHVRLYILQEERGVVSDDR